MLDLRAAQTIRWRNRPDLMVRELFGVELDVWQDEALRAAARQILDGMAAEKQKAG